MKSFAIRVYGILISKTQQVLVSDERIKGKYYTKFPGGGLEFGEGIRDCLIREFKEETGLDIVVGEHIYTTDYFQPSAFNPAHQIISIYYFVHVEDNVSLITKTTAFDFEPEQLANSNDCEVFRWVDWNNLNEDIVDFPIDKIVVKLIKEQKQV